ncbi:sphingolipid delta(4)-desaturase DES1-like [Symsagittifera roscoffensis]|uniref:sphingolipid delta(4)-desaturase DES1-like n=1 Tax=Symsagittifera roscoffensis TaxID=84072 RepID=UPI00307B1FC9
MGAKCTRTEFEYTYTDEPHASRRKQIIKEYPQVKQLYGPDYSMLFIVPWIVAFQVCMCWMLQDASWPITILLAYVIGGTVNQSLTLAMHENSHNTVFTRNYLLGRLFGMFITLPIGVPASISFKKYHSEHHQFMGDDVRDQDIPHPIEAKMFNRTLTKVLWLVLNPFFYALRPCIAYPKPVTPWEVVSFTVQMCFNYLMLVHVGGPKGLFYLLGGSLLGMGLHPMAGHFISEHYIFFDNGQQTSSYYGPMNYICWNVGYHNEHHDFPWISYRKLPKLKKMAPEYYDSLPHHTSWVKCLVDFVLNPDIGPFARIKTAASCGRISEQDQNNHYSAQPASQQDSVADELHRQKSD